MQRVGGRILQGERVCVSYSRDGEEVSVAGTEGTR